ncbi:MAG: hypothetical protein NVSMB63_05460 [Sediminibacterium sp.]
MAQHALHTKYVTHTSKANALVEVLTRTAAIVAKSRGCRLYMINQEEPYNNHVWVTELWDSPEDHAISLTLDGCKELTTEVNPLLSRPPEQVILKVRGGKGVE